MRPIGDYLLRVFCCLLMFGSGYSLLVDSTFAWRIRDDVTTSGARTMFIGIAAVLAFLPLAFGKRYLGAMLFSGFAISLIGSYWWTTIPWDELVTETDFTTSEPPGLIRYLWVASPAIVALLYVAASRSSRLRAEYVARGIDPAEATQASAASFLAGMGTIVVCMTLAGALWALLSIGALQGVGALVPTGVPAMIVAAALLAVAYVLSTSRPTAARIKRPSRSGEGRGVLARIRGRRSPS